MNTSSGGEIPPLTPSEVITDLTSIISERRSGRFERIAAVRPDWNPAAADARFLLPKAAPCVVLQGASSETLLALATEAMFSNAEVLTDCWLELNRRTRKKNLRELDKRLAQTGVRTITWLSQARAIANGFARTTVGTHHVYAILLGGYPDGSYGVYVGETRRRVEVRFLQHLVGRHASRVVPRRGIQLLPSLYEHLNPLSRDEAKHMEVALAEALRASGIRTEGGLPKRLAPTRRTGEQDST